MTNKDNSIESTAAKILILTCYIAFEAGIANAISSFKLRKIYLFMEKRHLPDLNVSIFRHLKLELLTQFPASNDGKYFYLW